MLTFLLGLTFLLTQVSSTTASASTRATARSPSTFFGLTGLHGCHVFVGLTILLIMTIRSFRGHFSPEHHHGVEIGGIYWHFVDVMWIVVYVTVYILCRCGCATRSGREAEAFRFVWLTIVYFALIVIGVGDQHVARARRVHRRDGDRRLVGRHPRPARAADPAGAAGARRPASSGSSWSRTRRSAAVRCSTAIRHRVGGRARHAGVRRRARR